MHRGGCLWRIVNVVLQTVADVVRVAALCALADALPAEETHRLEELCCRSLQRLDNWCLQSELMRDKHSHFKSSLLRSVILKLSQCIDDVERLQWSHCRALSGS